MHPVLETRQALFWTALVVQCAGETHVTASRIAASLLRTSSLIELVEHLRLEPSDVLAAVESAGTPSHEDCVRRVMSDLAGKGLEFASAEHQATVERRPLGQPAVRKVFDAILARHGAITVSPQELFLDLLRTDAALAGRLASRGLTVDAIRAAIVAGPSDGTR